jgi:hypothetical protein
MSLTMTMELRLMRLTGEEVQVMGRYKGGGRMREGEERDGPWISDSRGCRGVCSNRVEKGERRIRGEWRGDMGIGVKEGKGLE